MYAVLPWGETRSEVYAAIPWRESRRLHTSYEGCDTPEKVKKCLNCPKEDCDDCKPFKGKRARMRKSFRTLFLSGLSQQEILKALPISPTTYHRYKRELTNG